MSSTRVLVRGQEVRSIPGLDTSNGEQTTSGTNEEAKPSETQTMQTRRIGPQAEENPIAPCSAIWCPYLETSSSLRAPAP